MTRLTEYKNNNVNPYEGREGLVYVRVSSKKQETEGSGRKSQEERCVHELKCLGIPLGKTFPDTYTGGGDFMKRPAMRELLAFIDANPHKKFVVVFDDLKRFARDVEFHLKLRAVFRARNVILCCLNYNFDESPEGRFAEVVMAGQAELEREQNKRQVIQKQKARLENGYWPFPAPQGYYMKRKDPIHGTILEYGDKKTRELITEALEGFASGRYDKIIDVKKFLQDNRYLGKKYVCRIRGI
jgi:site-specific DNA recombinase